MMQLIQQVVLYPVQASALSVIDTEYVEIESKLSTVNISDKCYRNIALAIEESDCRVIDIDVDFQFNRQTYSIMGEVWIDDFMKNGIGRCKIDVYDLKVYNSDAEECESNFDPKEVNEYL